MYWLLVVETVSQLLAGNDSTGVKLPVCVKFSGVCCVGGKSSKWKGGGILTFSPFSGCEIVFLKAL